MSIYNKTNFNKILDLPFASEMLTMVKAIASNKDWSKRPRLTTLADHNFFRHDFLKLHHHLTNILLLTEQHREQFLRYVLFFLIHLNKSLFIKKNKKFI